MAIRPIFVLAIVGFVFAGGLVVRASLHSADVSTEGYDHPLGWTHEKEVQLMLDCIPRANEVRDFGKRASCYVGEMLIRLRYMRMNAQSDQD